MIETSLPQSLQSRLNLIIEKVSRFWGAHSHHPHFTFHGVPHSQIVYEKLVNLIQRLPKGKELTEDELFIVSAAAWLYEIGMQCTNFANLRPPLNITWRLGGSLSPADLQCIRANKHELTYHMIMESVRPERDATYLLQLGLEDDDYTVAIAAVCRGCSNDPLNPLSTVQETMLVNDKRIRLRLLVALLCLADRLYIGYTRVDVALLHDAYLSSRDKARWWAYHHTTTLPIGENMLIPFHYYLSEEHRPLLNHIRTLIEPDFRRSTNPVIQCLWDYGLMLSPHSEPSVDLPSGSRQSMTEEMRLFVSSIKVDEEIRKVGIVYNREHAQEGSLLVIDFENFLLELGLKGYFPTPPEASNMLFKLFRKARDRHVGIVTGLAAAHWDRPDLHPIAETLENAGSYQLLTAQDQQKGSEILLSALQKRLQDAALPDYVILVTPEIKMARIGSNFYRAQQPFSAWVNDTPNADPYYSCATDIQQLPDILELKDAQKVYSIEQANMQIACILRLENKMTASQHTLSFDEVSAALKQLELIKDRVDWWQLYLIHEDILQPTHGPNGYLLKFNATHPKVDLVHKKRDAVIGALQSLKPEGSGVPQNKLVSELLRHPPFQNNEPSILRFLELLQDEAMVSVDRGPLEHSGQALWQLNIADKPVVAFNAGRYLPLFVLGFDHAMVRTGHRVIHEHVLKSRLKSYMENNAADAAYQLALEQKWVKRQDASSQDKQYFRNDNLVNVELVTGCEDVQKILLSRDILLDILRVATSKGGLQRDALKHTLSHNHRFTVKLDEVDGWLTAFQNEKLLIVHRAQDVTDIERDCIKLNFDSPTLQSLLGRMHVYGVVMAMRILRALTPETGKTDNEIVDMLANRVTRGNKQLATWALEYAKHIRLIGSPKLNTPGAVPNTLSLQRHRIVERLEARQRVVCQALTTLVERLSRPHMRDGWVPLYLVIQKMEQDPQMFGYTHGEYDFWINRTVVWYKTVRIDNRIHPPLICPMSQEQR